jgi:hypothetical protein
VVLTEGDGTVLSPFVLGDLGPGVSTPDALAFLSTQDFQSAEFLATLNLPSFALSDGSCFTADTTALDTLLVPGAGPTLVAGSDLVNIMVTGSRNAPGVPEPASWLLLASAISFLGGFGALQKWRRAHHTPTTGKPLLP